jgi:hypothetical protein
MFRENPVRAGLVHCWQDWPYQGEIVYIHRAWHVEARVLTRRRGPQNYAAAGRPPLQLRSRDSHGAACHRRSTTKAGVAVPPTERLDQPSPRLRRGRRSEAATTCRVEAAIRRSENNSTSAAGTLSFV